jgi:hypothetical protein
MTLSYLPYDLQDGYIQNWLVAGPQAIAAHVQKEAVGQPASLLQKEPSKKSGITKMPVERGPLTEGVFQIGDYQGSWSYLRCEADHYVDLSATFPVRTELRAWAYTQVVSPAAQQI